MDEDGVRRHRITRRWIDGYCLRPVGNDRGTTSRKLLSTPGVDEGGGVRRHRITRRWILSTHRREGQWNNESKVTIHAPAWTRVVACAGTPHNASMVTVYAPAGTTVVVCTGTPHTTLRVTIRAPAWTKVEVCVGGGGNSRILAVR